MSAATEISDSLFELDRLTGALARIAAESVIADLPVERATAEETLPWNFLLRAASVLCHSEKERAQDAALRIVQGCLSSTSTTDDERAAAAVLLDRMGNRRAIDLAAQRDLIDPDVWNNAPVPLKLDVIRRRLELSISTYDGRQLHANPFQRQFWTAASRHKWVSVSAPTSAGKSFIVRSWLSELASRSESLRAAYIVPTRALIEEVGTELQASLAEHIGVYMLPWDADIGTRSQEIYVMTQERLHLLLGAHPDLRLDVIFIDEAQKFGDDQRGVLLQQVVDECTRRNPEGQVLLASPLTSNPALLLDGAPAGLTPLPLAIRGVTVTVNQNLLWADQVYRKPSDWKLQLVSNGEPELVSTFRLPFPPERTGKRLPLVAVALGGTRPGTVVYVSIPGDAERVALQIHDALGEGASLEADPEIVALRELVRRTVHPRYALSQVLERGVAFHYGSMPQLIRQEIERLFRSEKLRYLVCTSTLLEGVNLPCRLLVLRSPNKGYANPMTPGDFWNLAGRAGRWGREFQGNIVCVDASRPEVWPDPPRRRELQRISRAADATLQEARSLRQYIESGAPASRARSEPMLEAVFGFLSARALTTGTLTGVPALAPEDAPEVEHAILEVLKATELPTDLLLRHAGIGPLAMSRLLAHFRATTDWEQLLLPHAGSFDSTSIYTTALGVCHDVLGTDFGIDKRRFQLALLITDWIRGLPLAVIIGSRLRWLRNNRPDFKLNTEIRNVMRDIERVARFQAPKYLGCYLDILAFHLQSIGQHEVAAELPDISMMLELGVARTTEVSLMTLGLSRTTAVALSDYIAEPSLTRDEARDWLAGRDLDGYPLPNLVIEEVRRRVPLDER